MANLFAYDHTKTNSAALPWKLTHTYRLSTDYSTIRVRPNTLTGQIWPRGNYVAGQGWL